jgi:hypothetical protein
MAAVELLAEEAEALTRKAVEAAMRNADAKYPCTLPQEDSSAPCCPSAGSGIQPFDLDGLMVDRTGDFSGKIECSPCSQGRPSRRTGPE